MSESIIIVGGGAVGAAHGGGCAMALSFGCRRILEKQGFWSKLAQYVTAINSIHVLQLNVMKSIKQHLVSQMSFAK